MIYDTLLLKSTRLSPTKREKTQNHKIIDNGLLYGLLQLLLGYKEGRYADART